MTEQRSSVGDGTAEICGCLVLYCLSLCVGGWNLNWFVGESLSKQSQKTLTLKVPQLCLFLTQNKNLERVGPIDNRPSNDKLKQFVKKITHDK